ncbi:MAG: HAD family hydrolase [Anaerolineae bacterium]
MITGIIFDLGGTLLNFEGNLPDVERRGAENVAAWYIQKKRIKLDAGALAQAILTCRRRGMEVARRSQAEFLMRNGILKALQAVEAPQRAGRFATEATRVFFEAEEALHRPFPDAVETLKTLHARQIKLGILSNATDDALIQRLVNRNGLRPWVSPVFSSAGLGRQKPGAEPFRLIAKRWEMPPAQIAVVGDTPATDILGAKNAGMRSILIIRSPNQEPVPLPYTSQSPIQPDDAIHALAELPGLILGL